MLAAAGRTPPPSALPVVIAAAPVPPAPVRVFCFDCYAQVDPREHAGDARSRYHVTGPVPNTRPDEDGFLSVQLNSVTSQDAARLSSGFRGLDRVLGGGGFAEDSIVLLEGDPGIGKSTVLAMVASRVAVRGGAVLYVSGEEAKGQIGGRAHRLKLKVPDSVRLLITGSLEELLREVRLLDEAGHGPDLVIVDSAQAIRSDRVPGHTGSVTQVRFVADQLRTLAKTTRRIVVLVGQVTKEGDMAGPKAMEHAVDARLKFGRDGRDKRFILSIKNRYGAANELVTFQMGALGLVELEDPALAMLEDNLGEPGVVPFVAGNLARATVIAVQASVMQPSEESGARQLSALGFPMERLRFLLDLIGRYCDLALSRDTVRVEVPRVADEVIDDGALDLAVAAAIVSAKRGVPVRAVVLGGVGLSGKVLPVEGMDARIDAVRAHPLALKTVVVPKRTPNTPSIRRVPVEHLRDLPEVLVQLAAGDRAMKSSPLLVARLETPENTPGSTVVQSTERQPVTSASTPPATTDQAREAMPLRETADDGAD